MNKLIGKRIRIKRLELNVSQQEMADRMYLSQSTYNRMEKGKTATWVHHIEVICKAPHISEQELI